MGIYTRWDGIRNNLIQLTQFSLERILIWSEKYFFEQTQIYLNTFTTPLQHLDFSKPCDRIRKRNFWLVFVNEISLNMLCIFENVTKKIHLLATTQTVSFHPFSFSKFPSHQDQSPWTILKIIQDDALDQNYYHLTDYLTRYARLLICCMQ